MAVSVTSRPNTWSAIRNPIVYKFATTGGPFTNYRIEVEVFKASDDTSLTGGVKFAFSPDADDNTYAIVSEIIAAYLKAEWIEPSTINEAETDTSLKFYIKYQELYDGSAEAVVDDVANPKYAVFAGLQIPSAIGGDLTTLYVPASSGRKFLRIFDNPKLWRDYPATLSFIYPDALAALYLYRAQYDESGAIIGVADYDVLNAANDDSVNRLDLNSGFSLSASAKTLKTRIVLHGVGAEILTNPNFAATLVPWSTTGSGTNWAFAASPPDDRAAAVFAAAGTSRYLKQNIADQVAGWYYVTTHVESDAAGSAWTFIAEVYNNSVLIDEIINQAIPQLTLLTQDWQFLFYVPGTFDEVRIKVTAPNAGTFDVGDFSIKTFTPVNYTELLTFAVEDACDNPVLLVWKNSLGGDAWWLFDVDQEVDFNISGSKKAKRMMLAANNLTADQWTALEELNSIGEVYKENIIEFTSSVNKSHKQDGAQVYVVDADGNKTGVIVIPTKNVMFTRMQRHQFKIEIEFPEVQ